MAVRRTAARSWGAVWLVATLLATAGDALASYVGKKLVPCPAGSSTDSGSGSGAGASCAMCTETTPPQEPELRFDLDPSPAPLAYTYEGQTLAKVFDFAPCGSSTPLPHDIGGKNPAAGYTPDRCAGQDPALCYCHPDVGECMSVGDTATISWSTTMVNDTESLIGHGSYPAPLARLTKAPCADCGSCNVTIAFICTPPQGSSASSGSHDAHLASALRELVNFKGGRDAGLLDRLPPGTCPDPGSMCQPCLAVMSPNVCEYALCPNSCSGHGTCHRGACSCEEGWGDLTCGSSAACMAAHKCARGAQCREPGANPPDNFKACSCLPGLFGDPLVECSEGLPYRNGMDDDGHDSTAAMVEGGVLGGTSILFLCCLCASLGCGGYLARRRWHQGKAYSRARDLDADLTGAGPAGGGEPGAEREWDEEEDDGAGSGRPGRSGDVEMTGTRL